MGIYGGVNGVRQKVETPCAGVDGVVHTAVYGFNGLNGVRRQFFGPLEDVVQVEVRPTYFYIHEVDSSGFEGALVYSGTNIAEAAKYGSIAITDNAITVRGNTNGINIRVGGTVYAIFEDGREVPLYNLSEAGARYGAAISFPIGYSLSSGSNGNGWYNLSFNNVALYTGYFSSWTSGTVIYSEITNNQFWVSAGRKDGSSTSTTTMNFTNITIDGQTIPVRVVSKLKEEETT